MGSKYMVQAWTDLAGDRQWLCMHQGEHLVPALVALWRECRRRKHGCVKLEVR